MSRAACLAIAAVFAAGCAKGWTAIDRSALPNRTRYPESNAVVLEREARLVFLESGGEAVAELTERTRVLALERSSDADRPFQIPYSAPFSKVVSLRARVIEPWGKERELDTSRAIDHPLLEAFVVYSEQRALTFEPPPLMAGAILEVESVTQYRDLRLFRFDFPFGAEVPIERARLEVSAPRDWEVEWLAQRHDLRVPFEPTVNEQNGEVRRVWERSALPAIVKEDAAAGIDEQRVTVQTRLKRFAVRGSTVVAPPDAAALSAALHGMMPPESSHAEVRALTEEVLRGAGDDPRERARRLYEWVSARIQYCILHIGYGNWVPSSPDAVLERRFGDCKDKAELLRAMLSAAGIPSRLVALFAHEGLPRPFGLPSAAGNFNHMIVVVDLADGPVFADPTARTVPFGRLPEGDQDADALPLTAEGAALMHTPAEPLAGIKDELTLEARLHPDGIARGEARLTSTGSLAAERQVALIESEGRDRRGVVLRWLGLPHCNLKEQTVAGAPFSTQVEVRAKLELESVLRGSGDTRVVRMTDFTTDWLPNLQEPVRNASFAPPLAANREARFRFLLPAGATVAVLPKPATVTGPLGRYELTWSLEEGHLVALRKLTLSQRRVASNDYPALKAFAHQMFAAEAAAVVVRMR